MTGFWKRWLITAAAITGVAGLGFAALTAIGAEGVHDAVFDLMFLPDGLEQPGGEAASFAVGVTGAVMVGWAATMLVMLLNADASTRRSTWLALTIGLAAWFVVDGIVSIAVGALANVALNAVFAALYVPALIATRPGRG